MKNLNVAAILLSLAAAACGTGGNDPLPSTLSSRTHKSSSGGSSTSSSSGGQQCPAIACFAACEHGYAAGADGCPTCECLPPAVECGAITDEDACRAAPGCEAVFHDDEGGSSSGGVIGCGAPMPTTTVRFECCTQTDDGVFCHGEPPPPPADCRSTGCGPGFACEGTGACPVFDCACEGDAPCFCGGEPPCEVEYACVPVNTGDCRTDGCAAGETCEPGPVCEVACDCDPSTDLDCTCPPCDTPAWSCVSHADACATVRCGEGTVCQVSEVCPVVATCTCSSNDPTCECPLSPPCEQVAQCVPSNPDPCAALTQDQCTAASDRCTPVFVTACPACAAEANCPPCTEQYAGCSGTLLVDGRPGTPTP